MYSSSPTFVSKGRFKEYSDFFLIYDDTKLNVCVKTLVPEKLPFRNETVERVRGPSYHQSYKNSRAISKVTISLQVPIPLYNLSVVH